MTATVPPETPLSTEQLDLIEDCVSALVTHDDARLGELLEVDLDIYLWTRDYGHHGDVDLVMPPGSPADWEIDAVRVTAADRPTLSVIIDMWTAQEGRSDLSLELTLMQADDGRWEAQIDDLHVL